MWPAYIALVLLPTPILGQLHYQNQTPTVDLGYAVYSGTHNATSGINSWYGLRYAQAPTGELRWQPPMDIELKNDYNPTQTVDASKPGPSCMQGYPGWYLQSVPLTSTENEDCLLLDVMVPDKPVSSNLPVMVRIHGGGYTLGFAEDEPGNALVYQSRGNLIYVSVQYRLGVYGFLGGSAVSANGVANAGLLDQRAALMWVQRHISRFGGDPSQVTIVGGSAGAGCILDQMIMYGGVTNPPFRAAIAGYPWMQPYHDPLMLEKQFDGLRNASGCSDLACLRQLSRTQLRTAADETYLTTYDNGDYGRGDFFFGPSVDGNIIQDLPSNEFNLGRFTKIPLLTNREGYEGYLFTGNQTNTTEAEMMSELKSLFQYGKQSFFSRMLQVYPRTDFNSTKFQQSAIIGDCIVVCPSSLIAAALSDYGMPVWKLVFYAGSQVHAALQPFIESTNLEGTSNNATLAAVLRSYWISFATSLDPNAIKYTNISYPSWPEYQTPGVPGFKVLNITDTTIEPSDDLDARRQCDFFQSQSYVVRN